MPARQARLAEFAAVVLVASVLATGCGVYSRVCPRAEVPKPPASEQMQVTFLGVGGFLFRYRSQDDPPVALMTAPLYSNPTIAEVATQPVATDQRLVDALLERQLGGDPGAVAGILSGHSHYDHLMDVPYVALRWATRADLYGNEAMVKLLDPLRPALQGRHLVSLEAKAKDLEARRRWTDAECPVGLTDGYQAVGDYIRVWPILSEHSSQFRIRLPFVVKSLLPPAHLWRGDLLEVRKELPSRPGEWVEGTTLAYVIDFLSRPGGEVAFRIYYQDSGARYPFGFPSSCLLKQRAVDLAILCVGGAETLKAHPKTIVEWLRPRFVVASHWEDFFNPRTLPLPEGACTPEKPCRERISGIPTGKPQLFMKKAREAMPQGSSLSWPCPDTSTTFGRGPATWEVLASTAHWEGKP